jgi:hypothetical protein
VSAPGVGPWAALREAERRTRRAAAVGVALTVLSLVPLVLVVGWLVGDAWGERTAAPLAVVVVAAVAVVVVAVVLVRRWVRPVTEAAVAAAAERSQGLEEGSLRGVIELGRGLPAGASEALFRRRESELATRLAGIPPVLLAGEMGRRSRTRLGVAVSLAGVLGLLVGVAGFMAPERAREGWAPLRHPVDHLRGPVLPALTVSPGDVEVPRGRTLEIEVGAPLRDRVVLEWRTAGRVPARDAVPVVAGVGRGEIGPVDAVVRYRARTTDGAVSQWYTAQPVDPLLLRGLAVDLVYPDHVAREPERLTELDAAVLAVPAGTVLHLEGAATRVLAAASLRHAGGGERDARVAGDSLSLEWRIDGAASGHWVLRIRDVDGTVEKAASFQLTVAEDRAPTVRILVPAGDTVMPVSRRQAIVAEATDDHGIGAAGLVFQRIGRWGDRGSPRHVPMPVDGLGEVGVLRSVLDASDEPLVPGDAVEYHVVVRDNSPAGQTGRSGTYVLRVPSAAELRAGAMTEAGDLVQRAEGVAERARSLERETRDLARRAASPARSGSGAASTPGAPGPEFRRSSEARQLARQQEEAMRELAELRQRLDRLRELAAQAGLDERELDRRLSDLAQLYRELEQADAGPDPAALRAAADAPNPVELAAQLERAAQQQEEWRRALEEGLDQLRAAALEQEMTALAREAADVVAEQEGLNARFRETVESAGDAPNRVGDTATGSASPEPSTSEPSTPDAASDAASDAPGADPGSEAAGAESRAEAQQDLAGRTSRLADLIQSLQEQLRRRGDEESAGRAGAAQDQARSGQGFMEEAAERARQQDGDGAASAGGEAAGEVAKAARALDEARGRRADAGRGEVQEALRQGTQDALRLAEREEALRQEMDQAGGLQHGGGGSAAELQRLQSEQQAVRQGLEQLGQNLAAAARAAGSTDPAVARAMARAMLELDRTMDGLQPGQPLPVREAERAVESLNRLAMALLESEGEIRRTHGSATEQVLRQLTELAREQGALNSQTTALAPPDMPAGRDGSALQQLAEQQRGIARRVGEASGMMGGREDALGRLDQLSQEAAALAGELAGGRLTPDVRARQERLFHRLLDAGRSLEREEYSEERAGQVARDRDVPDVEALDPALLDRTRRYPAPTAEQLRTLPPAYRRLVLEYFQRLNVGAGDAAETPPGEGRQ